MDYFSSINWGLISSCISLFNRLCFMVSRMQGDDKAFFKFRVGSQEVRDL